MLHNYKIVYSCILFLFLMICQAPSLALAGETNSKTREENLNATLYFQTPQQLFDWIEGQYLEDESVLVYFNTSQAIFSDFVEIENVNEITINIHWISRDGSKIVLVNSESIDPAAPDFSIENWSHLINPADTLTGDYYTTIYLDGVVHCDKVKIPIVELTIQEPEPDLPVELPEFTCGEVFDPDHIVNQVSITNLIPGDIIFMRGFPVWINDVTGGSGNFSGEGIIPLPFGKKAAMVSFTNIHVNTDRVVTSGVMTLIEDEVGPDFTMNVVEIGGDICIPPPDSPGYDSEGFDEITGLDPWGFGKDSLHSETGTRYDNNGFDISGNHKDTGDPYNEQGCNREGFDEKGKACDPKAGPDPKSEAYAESLKPNLPGQVVDIIDSIKQVLSDSLASLDCESLRITVENIAINDLNFDLDYIFGENREFLNSDMHLQFDEPPSAIPFSSERNADAALLEEKHIELYYCDKIQYAFQEFIDVIDGLSPEQIQEIADQIADKISEWSEVMLDAHDDEVTFEGWLFKEMGNIIKQYSGLDDTYGYERKKPKSIYKQSTLEDIFKLSGEDPFSAMASTEHVPVSFGDAPDLLDALNFRLKQGDTYIEGYHRALFLEELANQQLAYEGSSDGVSPICFGKTVGNKTVNIFLENIRFSTENALLDAHLIIEDPGTGHKLILSGYDIQFGPTGLTGSSQLVLQSDVEIRLSNTAMLVVRADDTRAVWDCEGLQSLSLGAQIEFCREFIVPIGNDLKPLPEEERYRLDLYLDSIQWLEFSLEIDAPPFAVAGHEEVVWQIEQMVIDLSSTSTPEFKPVPGYKSPFLEGEYLLPQWKGFYMGQFKASFAGNIGSQDKTLTIGVEDVVIDGTGFSGEIFAEETVMSIDTGSVADWAFSIDGFQMLFLHNHLSGAGFRGDMKVPLFEEPMSYSATIFPNNYYNILVTPADSLTANALQSKVILSKNSFVEIEAKDGDFTALAHLNGSLYLNNNVDDKSAKMKGLCFQGLRISNKAPYIDVDYMGIDKGVDIAFGLAGFDLMLSNIRPYSPGAGRVGLGFEASLVLSDALKIAASGSAGIEGVLNMDEYGRQVWMSDRFIVNDLAISATIGGFGKIAGGLRWYGDDEALDTKWGKGFQGAVSIDLENFQFSVNASAQFGRKEEYKYFFVDGLVGLEGASKATGISIKGFGGGVAHHMSIGQALSSFSGPIDNTLPLIGQSMSGTMYEPNGDVGLGVKATVLLSDASEELMYGAASFIVEFQSNFGVRKIALQGAGVLMKTLDLDINLTKLPNLEGIDTSLINKPAFDNVSAAFTTYLDLELNFEKNTLDGQLLSYLNAPFIRGRGHQGQFVEAQLHFGPDSWYIYVGTPDDPAGAVLEIPILNIEIDVSAYFDVGNKIPPFPDLPSEVSEIASGIRKNEDLRQSGAGFAFGAAFDFMLEARLGGIASASLAAGAGFDVMLKRYQGLKCAGQPIGIDGWYASGQMWAYINGTLKAFGVKIIEAGFATVLQARLPNPFWAQALIGLKLKIGFIKVRKTLRLEIGNDCLITSDNPQEVLGIDVISYIDPLDEGEGIETSVQPTASLSLPLNRKYNVKDVNGNNVSFEARFKASKLTSASGIDLEHNVEFRDENQQIVLIPRLLLPANDMVTAEFTVDIFKDGVHLTEETKSTTFGTGELLSYIPESNIAAAYPPNGLYNYYPDEYNADEGFIELVSGQPELLYSIPDGYVQKVRLTSQDGDIQLIDYSYDDLNNRLSFPLGASKVDNDELYHIELVRAPEDQLKDLASGAAPDLSGAALAGLTAPNDFQEPSTDQNPTEDQSILAPGILYQAYFRVSVHNTVSQKMTAIMSAGNSNSDVRNITPNNEFFDRNEVRGLNGMPLLELDAVSPANTQWLNAIKSKFTELKTLSSASLCGEMVPDFRVEDVSESIKFTGKAGFLIGLTPNQFNGGYTPSPDQTMQYNLDHVIRTSFNFIKTEVVNCMAEEGVHDNAKTVDNTLETIESLQIPANTGGKNAIYNYRLPNGRITTSRTIIF